MKCIGNEKVLYIIGGHSTALEIKEVFDYFYRGVYSVIYNVIAPGENTALGNTVFDPDLDGYLKRNSEIYFITGMTNPELKNRYRLLFKDYGGVEVNCIHPTSYISASARIGKGVYCGPYSVISSRAVIEDGSFINIHASVGHDCHIGKDCCINPGARVSGNVSLGDRTLVGANSCIFQGIKIGSDCAVDAMTYVERDIGDVMICTSRMGGLKVYKNKFIQY